MHEYMIELDYVYLIDSDSKEDAIRAAVKKFGEDIKTKHPSIWVDGDPQNENGYFKEEKKAMTKEKRT